MIATMTAPLRRLCLALLLPLAVACSGPEAPERGPLVLAASSLQEALEEAGAAWAAEGHAAPVLSFAATSALARQVEQGAPADLFVSADEEWMDTLADGNLLRPGTRIDLLSNRVVLVAGKGGAIRTLAALGDGRLALADPNAVPAGKYARAALESLGEWQGVADNVVPAENVRAALASDKVEVVRELPESSHPPIRYPVAILAASESPDAAGFLAFLSSAKAKAIFEKHGFGTVE